MSFQNMNSTKMNVPFKISFDQAKLYEKYSNQILWISSGILIFAFVIQSINNNLKNISDTINILNCFLIVAYAILEILTTIIFYEASKKKRYDYIDNSFQSLMSDENSKNYFSNDDLNCDIYKMAVNGFENVFFTYKISEKMQKPLWIKNVLISFLFVMVAILGLNNIFVMLLQLSLPFFLLKQAIKQNYFVGQIEQVCENYRKLFDSIKDSKNYDSKIPTMLINLLEYETTLSWANILLDEKIYNSLNPALSADWEKIKLRYKIMN